MEQRPLWLKILIGMVHFLIVYGVVVALSWILHQPTANPALAIAIVALIETHKWRLSHPDTKKD